MLADWAELSRCRFEIYTLDDRRPAQSVEELTENDHRSMTAVLNQAYAARFGYDFRLVHWNWSRVRRSSYRRFHPAWGKVFLLRKRLRELEAEARSPCTWLLYLDSDAYVREFDLPLPVFLQGLAERYPDLRKLPDAVGNQAMSDTEPPGAIFTRERSVAVHGFRPRRAWVNSGVFLLRAGRQSASATALLDEWIALAEAAEEKLRHAWPWDQVALTELLKPGTFPWARWSVVGRTHRNLSGAAALVDMVEMNSPWGRFVQHLWAGTTAMTRGEGSWWDALVRVRADTPRRFSPLLRDVNRNMLTFPPAD